MEIEIYRRGDRESEPWILMLKNQSIKLFNEDDELIAKWKPEGFLNTTKMPSFFESRKHVEFLIDGQDTAFDMSEKKQRELQEYLDKIYLKVHPNAVMRKMGIALAFLLGGIGVAAAGIIATMSPNSKAIYYGAILFGSINAVWGLIRLCEYPRWKRLEAETE